MQLLLHLHKLELPLLFVSPELQQQLRLVLPVQILNQVSLPVILVKMEEKQDV
jgi:hypothetical protein